METWTTIRNQLHPYVMKLKNAGKLYYVNKLDELTCRLDLTRRDKLEPTFLQGYSSQLVEYRSSYKKQEDGKPEE